MENKIKLVVINEQNLGYILPDSPEYAGLLRASVLKGSTFNEQTGSIYIKNQKVRLATRSDFNEYRVNFTGYDNGDYIYSDSMKYIDLPLHLKINYKGYHNLSGRTFGTITKQGFLWGYNMAWDFEIVGWKRFEKLTTKIFNK
jgi:hypothetical protein